LSCTFPINAVATKLSLNKAYFTFTSSNTAVATVSALGVGACVSVGTSAITAKLGAVSATGTLTVNVIAGTVPTVAAPTPTRLAANVISLYSKPYTNLTGTDWFPNWGQTTVVSDVLIAGDSTKKYANFNYQGVQFAKPIDASTMGFLHIDLWTPSMTSFKVFLINIPPTVTATVEQAVTLTPTLSGWNSFDIPLSSYNTIVKTGIGQFKLESVPSGTTGYLDNIYFYKTTTGTNDVTFAKNLFTTGPSVSDASLTLFLTENVKNTAQVTLTNISGQVVYSQTATANSTHLIATKNLPAGMYIVGVRVGSTIQSEKIVVSH
jgi:hypothetical protein